VGTILHFLFGTGQQIDRTAFWSGIAAISAGIAVLVAWLQLSSLRKTSRADFVKRFIDSFFVTETRSLFTLFMNSALEFDELKIKDDKGEIIDHLPYFKIKKDVADQLGGIVFLEKERTGFSAFEIDDFLLGYFDDLGWYEKKNLIDIETINQVFHYYIIESWDNTEVKKYLGHKDNEGKYEDFEYIKNRCLDYQKLQRIYCPCCRFLLFPIWKVFWKIKKIFWV
jgi:hypothetical protein